jgi:hypothetical protein
MCYVKFFSNKFHTFSKPQSTWWICTIISWHCVSTLLILHSLLLITVKLVTNPFITGLFGDFLLSSYTWFCLRNSCNQSMYSPLCLPFSLTLLHIAATNNGLLFAEVHVHVLKKIIKLQFFKVFVRIMWMSIVFPLLLSFLNSQYIYLGYHM